MNEAFDELAELVGRVLAERWLNERQSRPKGRAAAPCTDTFGGHNSDKPQCGLVPPQAAPQTAQNQGGRCANKPPSI